MVHHNLLAQAATPTPISLGTFKGLGALSDFIDKLQQNPTNPEPAATTFTKFLTTAVGIMTVIAFIWFIFTLFIGAIAWLGSGGDKTKLQNAQKQITHGIIGLIVVISSIFLIKIIGVIFGIEDILNIGELIKNL